MHARTPVRRLATLLLTGTLVLLLVLGLDRTDAADAQTGTPPPSTGGPTSPGSTDPSMPSCDFDADGNPDLAIGVPGENGKGAVNVQQSPSGFLSWPTILLPDLDRGADFGAALVCDDFDGNGVDDLAVGAPGVNSGEGRVYFYWGKKTRGLDPAHWFWFDQDAPGIPGAADAGDHFGQSLETGDFDGNGTRDLAIGVPNDEDPDSDANNPRDGSVIVARFHGGPISFADSQRLFGWDIGHDHETDGQQFGWSLAAGPLVDGKGDDLVVGAPDTNVDNPRLDPTDCDFGCDDGYDLAAGAGRVYVFRNHAGLVSHQAIDQKDAAFDHPGSEHGDGFGHAVALGDVNADGDVDLVAGTPGEDLPAGTDAGLAQVFSGDGTWLAVADPLFLVEQLVGGAIEKYDAYGFSVAAGDWDDDGDADVAVGAPLDSVNVKGFPVDNAGAVFVHRGGAGFDGANGFILTQEHANVGDTSEPNDWFGASLTSVELYGGVTGLVIGVPGDQEPDAIPNGKRPGGVQLLFGWPGAGPATDVSLFVHQDTEAPFAVADHREPGGSSEPFPILHLGDGVAGPTGELFGWAASS